MRIETLLAVAAGFNAHDPDGILAAFVARFEGIPDGHLGETVTWSPMTAGLRVAPHGDDDQDLLEDRHLLGRSSGQVHA